MARLTDRLRLLPVAGFLSLGLAMGSGAVTAQSADIAGTVRFEGEAAIPKGRIEIHFEDPSVQGAAGRRPADLRIDSDGKAREIAFSFPLPDDAAVLPGMQIVASLKREDGWLLARGSAKVKAGARTDIALNVVMY